MALFAVMVLSARPSLAEPIVSIQPAASTPTAGSFFDVFVEISSVTDLYAFLFDISFDPALLSAASITEGAFLPSGGGTVFVPGVIDNTAGTISFTIDSLIGAGPGVSGSGTLATIDFQANAVGTSAVGISNVILLDANLSSIAFSSTNGQVEVGSATGIPEPATLALLTLGLAGLGLSRRKQ